MKYALALTALLTALCAAPALAADTYVPQSTLSSLGLGEMEVVSDEVGMEVRGMSGSAMTMGLSLVTGLLIDPNTKSFIFGSDANAASATAENAGKQILTQASHAQASALNLSLNVTSTNGVFTGTLVGGAGGSGVAMAQ